MQKQHQLSINLISNILAFVINMGMGFIFTPFIINKVGSEAYGFYSLSNQFVNYITIFTVALNSMVSRFVSVSYHKEDLYGAQTYFNSALFANFIIAAVIAIPAVFAIAFMNYFIDVPLNLLGDVKLLFLLILVNFLTNMIGGVFNVATFIKNKIYLRSIRDVEMQIIKVLIIIILYLCLAPKISYTGIAVLISGLFYIYRNIIYTQKLTPELRISKKYFKLSAIKDLVFSGIWNSVNRLSSVLIDGVDLLISNILVNATGMADLAIAKTVPTMLKSLMFSITSVCTPQLTLLYAKEKRSELIVETKFYMKVVAILFNIILAGLIVFGLEFFRLWIPDGNITNYYILSIFTIIPMFIGSCTQTLLNINTITNKLRLPAVISILIGVLNIVATIILFHTTSLGIYAVVISSAVFQVLRDTLFTPVYAAFNLNIKWYTFYGTILRSITTLAVLTGLFYIIKLAVSPSSWLLLIIAALICTVIGGCINILIMLNKVERDKLIKQYLLSVIKKLFSKVGK